MQIVDLDGLQLLLPLTKSKDTEVQRLAAHALANLSVNCTYEPSLVTLLRGRSLIKSWCFLQRTTSPRWPLKAASTC